MTSLWIGAVKERLYEIFFIISVAFVCVLISQLNLNRMYIVISECACEEKDEWLPDLHGTRVVPEVPDLTKKKKHFGKKCLYFST
jgi:hypothetical protein